MNNSVQILISTNALLCGTHGAAGPHTGEDSEISIGNKSLWDWQMNTRTDWVQRIMAPTTTGGHHYKQPEHNDS